jgi:hypothetical protein
MTSNSSLWKFKLKTFTRCELHEKLNPYEGNNIAFYIFRHFCDSKYQMKFYIPNNINLNEREGKEGIEFVIYNTENNGEVSGVIYVDSICSDNISETSNNFPINGRKSEMEIVKKIKYAIDGIGTLNNLNLLY